MSLALVALALETGTIDRTISQIMAKYLKTGSSIEVIDHLPMRRKYQCLQFETITTMTNDHCSLGSVS